MNIDFQKFPGGDTPGPPLTGWRGGARGGEFHEWEAKTPILQILYSPLGVGGGREAQ